MTVKSNFSLTVYNNLWTRRREQLCGLLHEWRFKRLLNKIHIIVKTSNIGPNLHLYTSLLLLLMVLLFSLLLFVILIINSVAVNFDLSDMYIIQGWNE